MILLLFIVVAAAPVFLEQGCTGGMGVFRIIRNVKDVVILFSFYLCSPEGRRGVALPVKEFKQVELSSRPGISQQLEGGPKMWVSLPPLLDNFVYS